MKPRISLRPGLSTKRLWACVSVVRNDPFVPMLVTGYGYSPAEAFADWAAQ